MKEQMNEGEASRWSRVLPELSRGNFIPLGAAICLVGLMSGAAAWALGAISWVIIALLGSAVPALHRLDDAPEWLAKGGLMAFGVWFGVGMLLPMRDMNRQGIWPFIDPEIEAHRAEQKRLLEEQQRRREKDDAGQSASKADVLRLDQKITALQRRLGFVLAFQIVILVKLFF
jgi:hypothetical protein